MAKKQAAGTVVFRAMRFKSHRIVLDPKAKKEVRGQLVTTALEGKFSKYPHGLTVEFENGFYETSDPEVIEALKAHEDYGTMFDSTDEKEFKQTPEALRKQNERAGVVGNVANTDPSVCPECGKKMKNAQGVEIHMREHQK